MARGTVPGTHKSILVRREILPVFLDLLLRINREVMPLDKGPLDSWEYRDARLGGGLSNHASGTAIDFRYDVLKADHKVHMTGAQRAKMESILNSYKTADGHRVFGWGGEWKPGVACDEMHIEVGQAWQVGRSIGVRDFQYVQAHLHHASPTAAPKPKPAPKPAPSYGSVHLAWLKPGLTNGDVKRLQTALHSAGYKPGPINGTYDAQTRAAVRALQLHLGFKGADADGIPGAKSLAALKLSVDSGSAPKPSTFAPTVHLHLLKRGLTNADVKELQRALTAHGYKPGPIDGGFGPKTQAAVRALQLHLGFKGADADGLPGGKSLDALGLTVTS